jgi:hypothetical protein
VFELFSPFFSCKGNKSQVVVHCLRQSQVVDFLVCISKDCPRFGPFCWLPVFTGAVRKVPLTGLSSPVEPERNLAPRRFVPHTCAAFSSARTFEFARVFSGIAVSLSLYEDF